jgi:predicted negative regulator of RcsB-dependent stress response
MKNYFRRIQMEFLIIAVILAFCGYFGYQYYLVKKTTVDPYISKLATEAKEAAKKVDVQVVLDVNKDGKVDMADATIIADTAKKTVAKVKAAKKPAAKTTAAKKPAAKKPAAKKKPTMKIVK